MRLQIPPTLTLFAVIVSLATRGDGPAAAH